MLYPPPVKSITTLFLALVCSSSLFAQTETAPEKLGLPGDNLNLAVVLDVFQQSRTLEDFENALNADTSKINNLDLNNDGRVDYIKVFDKPEGDLHTIVLQIDVNQTESQDVAVIFVEKKGDDVKIQLVGDEELYGKDYILEPSSDRRTTATANPGYKENGTTTNYTTNNYYYNTDNNYYNSRPAYCPPPSSWVIIGFIYGPAYLTWYSPWHWGYYPVYWNPWYPSYWDVYYNHWYYHHSWHGWWYWRAPYHHFDRYYAGYRTTRHHSGVVMNYRTEGVYNKTYSNPKPEPRPAVKPNFPSHAMLLDKNPAVVKPAANPSKGDVPQPVIKDTKTTTPVKETKSTTPVKETKSTTPVKETPKTTTPVKEQAPKKSTPPAKVDPAEKQTTPPKVIPRSEPIKPSKKSTVTPSKTRQVVPPAKTTSPTERKRP